ncbi:MAG: hydrolase 1, exosortase A system-associated, partial [Gammaproteobacteria bacterium]
MNQRALRFRCQDDWLTGVVHLPAAPAVRGVLIVVGGPQYRAGSHRQFTLLARALAQEGIPVMRFDVRGMGDSEGEPRDFTDLQDDLRAAIDAFQAAAAVQDVVLWGLCDGASAAMLYAAGDARVRGLALLNPWARTESGAARATLKHYYASRLLQPGLWRKIASGQFDVRTALGSLLSLLRSARAPTRAAAQSLPDRLRVAVLLYYFADLSVGSVATQ